VEGFAILLVLVVGATVVAIGYSINQRRQATEAWREAAAHRQLLFREGDFFTQPEIVGTVHGHRLTVSVARRGGESSTKYTRYRLEYRVPLPVDLRITTAPDGFLASMRRAMAGGAIETGDPAFDSRFNVTGSEPDRIRTFLTEPLRRVLLRTCERHPGIEITHRQLSWDVRDIELNPRVIVGVLDRLLEAANDLCHHVRETDTSAGVNLGGLASPNAVPAGTPSYHLPRSAEHTRRLDDGRRRPPGEQREKPTDTAAPPAPVEGTPVSVSERGDTPDDRGERPDIVASAQPRSRGPSDAAPPLPGEPQTASTGDTGMVRDVAPLGDSAIEAVCAAVFDESVAGGDAPQRFAERYRGRAVHWSGRLDSVARYPFDRVFGSEPGCRAVCIVHRMERSFGSRDVRAVVQLPVGAERELRTSIGMRCTIEGRLIAYDRFMQTLFLADGRVRTDRGAGTPPT
jgi:hypothetical protein